jgi:rod shape-determining protein MreD
MKLWRIILLILGLLVLQSSLIPALGLPLARPDLVLLLTIYVGLAARPEKSTLTGFLAGVCQDAFSVEVPGLNPFAKSLIGFLTPSVRRSFIVTNIVIQLVAVAVLTLVHALTLYWMGEALRQKPHEAGAMELLSDVAMPQVVSHLVFWLLLLPVFRWTLPPNEDER